MKLISMVIVIVLVLAAPLTVWGQNNDKISQLKGSLMGKNFNARLAVKLNNGENIEGTFIVQDEDSFTILVNGINKRLLFDQIDKVDINPLIDYSLLQSKLKEEKIGSPLKIKLRSGEIANGTLLAVSTDDFTIYGQGAEQKIKFYQVNSIQHVYTKKIRINKFFEKLAVYPLIAAVEAPYVALYFLTFQFRNCSLKEFLND